MDINHGGGGGGRKEMLPLPPPFQLHVNLPFPSSLPVSAKLSVAVDMVAKKVDRKGKKGWRNLSGQTAAAPRLLLHSLSFLFAYKYTCSSFFFCQMSFLSRILSPRSVLFLLLSRKVSEGFSRLFPLPLSKPSADGGVKLFFKSRLSLQPNG